MADEPLTPAAGAGQSNTSNPGATFDQKVFRDDMMGEVNRALNGFAARFDKAVGKLLEPKEPQHANPNVNNSNDPEPVPEPKEAKTIAELNLQLSQHNKKLGAVEAQLAASEKEKAEEKARRLETERVAAFDAAITDIPFANPKARQQFRNAYMPQMKRDEDGTYIFQTEKGVIGHEIFLKAEADESPHFLASRGEGGAGANAGAKVHGGRQLDVLGMSHEELAKVPADQKAAALRDLMQQAQTG